MEKTTAILRVVLLAVGEQPCAVHASVVDRVVRMVEVTPLPDAPGFVEGVINIQGALVPVLSIRRRLGLPARVSLPSDFLIIARCGVRRLALIAESISGVIDLPAADFTPTERLAPGPRYIEGVLKSDDGLILLQDIDRFFSSEEALLLDLALEKEV